jgi:hypothetical protein
MRDTHDTQSFTRNLRMIHLIYAEFTYNTHDLCIYASFTHNETNLRSIYALFTRFTKYLRIIYADMSLFTRDIRRKYAENTQKIRKCVLFTHTTYVRIFSSLLMDPV